MENSGNSTGGNWDIKKKLIVLMILTGLIPLILSFVATSKVVHENILELNKSRLTSLRESKKLQIENYFKQIGNQVITFSTNTMTVDALGRFSTAFSQVEDQMQSKHGDTQNSKLMDRYKYQMENTPGVSSDAATRWFPKQKSTQILQSLYISENTHPIGEKEKLDTAGDYSSYTQVHEQFHPMFRQYLEKFGYYDIFLVDADTGFIVYSVFKEIDYATNLKTGPYSNSGIGRAFNAAIAGNAPDFVAIDDFSPYEPSYNAAASFIASPVYDVGEMIGVLIFQAPVDRIDAIMTSNKQWKKVGLGDSGEVYMVGPDFKLRNNSRFFVETPKEYFSTIEKLGVDPKSIEKQKALGTTIGIAEVRSLGSKAALQGQSGFQIFPDYRSVPVLSSYGPVDILGLKWGILAELDEAEAFITQDLIKDMSLYISIGLGVVILIIAIYIAGLTSRRIKGVVTVVEKIANGDLKQQPLNNSSSDEIGDLTRSSNQMLATLQLLQEQTQEIAAGQLDTQEVLENIKQGQNLDQATGFIRNKYQVTKGDLADALDNLNSQMRKLAVQANLIANDDLNNQILDTSLTGDLGEAFTKMTEKMKWVAGQAGYIATNDLYNSNLKDDTNGTLGDSMSTMVKNLRVATTEMARSEAIMKQMPTNVLYADTDLTMQFMNPESAKTLKTLEQYLPTKVDDMIGQSIDIFHKNPAHQRKILSDPKNLPHTAQIQVGPEILDLLVSPLFDESQNYLGPMLTWEIITQKLEMEKKEREQTDEMRSVMMQITEVVQTLGASSEELAAVSTEMGNNSQATADQANEVSSLADIISQNVQTVATGTEEMSASIKEISGNSSEARRSPPMPLRVPKRPTKSSVNWETAARKLVMSLK